MIRPRQRLHAVSVVDYRGGTVCAGTTRCAGDSAIIAAAWIESLHSRAQRHAERHLRTA